MGHTLSSTIFVIILIMLVLDKTKFATKIDFIKLHKNIGKLLIAYLIGYSIVDYRISNEATILLIIPSLIGIYLTGKYKNKIKFKYAHLMCITIFLVTLLSHIFLF